MTIGSMAYHSYARTNNRALSPSTTPSRSRSCNTKYRTTHSHSNQKNKKKLSRTHKHTASNLSNKSDESTGRIVNLVCPSSSARSAQSAQPGPARPALSGQCPRRYQLMPRPAGSAGGFGWALMNSFIRSLFHSFMH